MTEPLVLGIETSCDETGVGIVRGNTLLANIVASSMDEHARYGGVVPEVAARAHLEALPSVVTEALETAGVSFAELDAIAVTTGPGLAGEGRVEGDDKLAGRVDGVGGKVEGHTVETMVGREGRV